MPVWDVPGRLWTLARKVKDLLELQTKTRAALEARIAHLEASQGQLIVAQEARERSLRESEELFRGTFEQAAVGMSHISLGGAWLQVNNKLCEITGYSRDEMLAHTFREITHPDDLQADLALREAVLAGEIETFTKEKRYLRKDGSIVWINVTVSLLNDADGKPGSFIAVIEDISARKRTETALRESEARFRAAVQAVNGLMWTSNTEGRQVEEQAAWAALTGQSREDYQGYGWSKALHPDDVQPTLDAWEAAVAERRAYFFEHRVRRHDGAWRRFTVHAVPVLADDGTIREWVGVHTDVTEQRKATPRN